MTWKKPIWAAAIFTLLLTMGLIMGCTSPTGGGGGNPSPGSGGKTALATPTGLSINGDFDLSWNTVTGAVAYRISVNDKDHLAWRTSGNETTFHLGIDTELALTYEPITHRVKVQAVAESSDPAYKDSAYSSHHHFQTAHHVFTFETDENGHTITGLTDYGKKLKHIVIPHSVAVDSDNVLGEHADVTKIGEEAFKDHENLEIIQIPHTVEHIEDGAFSGSSELHTVHFHRSHEQHGDTGTTLGENVFDGCDSLENIHVPDESVDHYAELHSDKHDVEVSASMVTGVTLNKTSIELIVGEPAETLTATVSPAEAANKKVSWTTNNRSVATVDANGTVTAVRAGTAIITVTTADGSYKATCTVTVKETITVIPKALWEVSGDMDKDDDVTVTDNGDGTLTITAINGYTPLRWYVNSVPVSQTGSSYTFDARNKQNGDYSVGLVAVKNGRTYNANITIMVTN